MNGAVELLLAAVVAVIAFAGWRRLSVWLWPNAPCRRCNGKGKNAGSNRQRWGSCRRCGGKGTRRRFGAKQD